MSLRRHGGTTCGYAVGSGPGVMYFVVGVLPLDRYYHTASTHLGQRVMLSLVSRMNLNEAKVGCVYKRQDQQLSG